MNDYSIFHLLRAKQQDLKRERAHEALVSIATQSRQRRVFPLAVSLSSLLRWLRLARRESLRRSPETAVQTNACSRSLMG